WPGVWPNSSFHYVSLSSPPPSGKTWVVMLRSASVPASARPALRCPSCRLRPVVGPPPPRSLNPQPSILNPQPAMQPFPLSHRPQPAENWFVTLRNGSLSRSGSAPHFVVSTSPPHLLVSSSPHLLVSSSPRLLVSSSLRFSVSSSLRLFVSPSPRFSVTPSPPHPLTLSSPYALTLAEKRGEVLIEMQRLVGLTRSAARTFVQACCRGSAVGTPSRQGNGGPDRLAQGVGGGAIHPP